MSIIMVLAALCRETLLLVSYLNNNSFPQPLSPDKEKEYIQRLQNKDSVAREKLIEHNMRLVAHVIKKYENSGYESEELISIGMVGLVKAIDNYNKDKGTKLSTFAARCIENEVLMFLRKEKSRPFSLQESLSDDNEGNSISLLEVLGTEEEIVLNKVEFELMQEKLYRVLKKLGNRERKVLAMRFGLKGNHRATQREVARVLGISRSYVSRIEKKALEKITREFDSEIYEWKNGF